MFNLCFFIIVPIEPLHVDRFFLHYAALRELPEFVVVPVELLHVERFIMQRPALASRRQAMFKLLICIVVPIELLHVDRFFLHYEGLLELHYIVVVPTELLHVERFIMQGIVCSIHLSDSLGNCGLLRRWGSSLASLASRRRQTSQPGVGLLAVLVVASPTLLPVLRMHYAPVVVISLQAQGKKDDTACSFRIIS